MYFKFKCIAEVKMKPRISKLTIVLIISAIIIITGIVLALFFFTDIFRSNKGAFSRYFKTISKSIEILDEDKYDSYNNLKETMPYIRKAEAYVQSSSNVADTAIMDRLKINLTEKTDYKSSKSNIEISIKSQNVELSTIKLIRDKQQYGFYCPDIANGYVVIKNENLKELINSMGKEDYIPDEINEIRMHKLVEKTNVEQSHIESYYNFIKANTPDSAYSKKKNAKARLRNETYNTTEYSLKLSSKESADLQIELLSKLSQDSIMMNFITSKARLLNFDNYISDINLLNNEIQARIEKFKKDPSSAEEIEITINEYKQKNLKTTIKIGEYSISIYHLKEGDKEISVYGINDKSLSVSKEGEEYIIRYSYTQDDIDKAIEIKHKMEGSIEDNNIKNIMEITTINGIKSVNYSYSDQITFTNDIGTIGDLSNEIKVVLNEYPRETLEPFMLSLKRRINEVYISKGATIGINLDPIFNVY